jgi:hypothetical protein
MIQVMGSFFYLRDIGRARNFFRPLGFAFCGLSDCLRSRSLPHPKRSSSSAREAYAALHFGVGFIAVRRASAVGLQVRPG